MTAMKLLLTYLAVVTSCCEAYKILLVFPMPSKSHGILGDGIVRHLIKDGHEVTYISPLPYKPASTNVRWIDISANLNFYPPDLTNLANLIDNEIDLTDHNPFTEIMIALAKFTIENDNVQKLLNDPKEEFDAVITEWMYSELPVGYAAIFNCPHIWSSSMDAHWTMLRLIDQPSNPAVYGDIFSRNVPPFNFYQRVTELFTQLKVQYARYMYLNEIEKNEYEELIAPLIVKRGRQPPSYYDIQYNTSLVLGNSHYSLGQPVTIPQNYIPIGGYHIEEKVEPLPDDLKKIMDNAKNGVIYFSMGSNLKSNELPKEIKKSLLEMFGQLKQTVLWKFEENLPNAPKNVHILKWAPQPSILSHPNTVVFITHGGLLSTTEAIHFGVPIIGLPVFGDQFLNVIRSTSRGFALKVDISYSMANKLKAAIKEITTNPRYAQKAKELSFIYHDRSVSPGKDLVHWVKHVIQTRGAPHLRSPALDVPFYQKLYLDLLVIVLVIFFVILKLLKCVCYHLFSSKKNVDSKKIN